MSAGMEQPQVWIVESGQWDEYQINGVFSTEERAAEYAAHLNGPEGDADDARVIPWDLDEMCGHPAGAFRATDSIKVFLARKRPEYSDFIPWEPESDPTKEAEATRMDDDGDCWIEAWGPTKKKAWKAARRLAKSLAAPTDRPAEGP